MIATIFVVVNQISTANYLNWDQLLELSRNGISIQSHTLTHRPLEDLSTEEVFYELSASKRILEEKLDNKVNFLSLPHGSFHPQLFRIARELGYTGICSSRFGYVNPTQIQFTVGRIPVKRGHQLKEFEKLVSQNKLFVGKYSLFLLMTHSISNILGLKNYARIYRFIFHIKPEC
jgi:peptidoglycan/xylan/chitin deacetylase (PgdA/CDA1 family)